MQTADDYIEGWRADKPPTSPGGWPNTSTPHHRTALHDLRQVDKMTFGRGPSMPTPEMSPELFWPKLRYAWASRVALITEARDRPYLEKLARDARDATRAAGSAASAAAKKAADAITPDLSGIGQAAKWVTIVGVVGVLGVVVWWAAKE